LAGLDPHGLSCAFSVGTNRLCGRYPLTDPGKSDHTVANVQQSASDRHADLLGRVTASQRFLVYGAEAVGTYGRISSFSGGSSTYYSSLLDSMVLGVLPALFSPLARLRDMCLQERGMTGRYDLTDQQWTSFNLFPPKNLVSDGQRIITTLS